MRKSWVVLSLALMGLGFFVSAQAQDKFFYIKSSGGNNNANGRSVATAWATIDKFNTDARAATNYGGNDSNSTAVLCPSGQSGDQCTPGAIFTHFPNPAVAATGGKRYFFRPLCDVSLTGARSATKVQIPTGTLSKNYVSLRGLYINGFLRIDGGRDSVVDCVVAGPLSFQNSYRSVVNNCDINGNYIAFNGEQPNVGVTMACELSDCRAPNLSPNSTCPCPAPGFSSCAKPSFWLEQHTDSCLIYRNRITITSNNLHESNKPILIKYSSYNTFRGNRFDLSLGAECGNEYNWWMTIRDSVLHQTFRADTFFINNTLDNPNFRSTFYGAGNVGNEEVNNGLTMDSCFIKLNLGNAISAHGPMRQWTFTNNIIFVENGHALHAPVRMEGPSRFENNTFVGNMASMWDDVFTDCGYRVNSDNAGANLIQYGFKGDTCKFFSNIFVNTHAGHQAVTGNCDRPYAMNYGNATGTVTGTTDSTGMLKTQWNCYYSATWFDSTGRGDGSIGWFDGNGAHHSYPGKYGAFKTEFHKATSDSFSVFGDPWLGGINALALTYDNFEPWLGVESAAKTAGKSGVSAGAVQYAEAGIPRIALSTTALEYWASPDNPDYSATQTIIITNTTDGTADLELTNLTVSHSSYLTVYFSKTTIAPGDTAALVVNVANAPTSGIGEWQISFDTNDPVDPGFDIPVHFREPRSYGTLEP